MAYDEALAQALRTALAGEGNLSERKMFGGLCLMLDGNMVCGTYRDQAMYRVGKAHEAEALAMPQVRRMAMAGRPMSGFVEAERAAATDPDVNARLMRLALDFVRSLPPK
jgi:TfoX/Sxy family transcriptional regulator of competence genes